MSITVKIGTWLEPAARRFDRCPSYYAADHETLEVKPGRYAARLTFEGGFTIPMPYWLLVGIDCERVNGRLYSGFGGVNFASTELEAGEAVTYTIQGYCYHIAEHVKAGRLELEAGYEWLIGDADAVWKNAGAPTTWAEVEALKALEVAQ